MAGTSNANNSQQPATHQRSASQRHRPRCTPASTEPTRSPEEEARDILAAAAKNQAEDGPNTRRAAVRACKYLRAMVNQHGSTIHEVHKAARIHTQLSKGTAGSTTQYRPQGGELPVISPELTSELLHCLSTLPDHATGQDHYRYGETKPVGLQIVPTPLCSRICQTNGGVPRQHTSKHRNSTQDGPKNLPKLEARMIEFLAEWLVTFLIPATHVLEVRAPHLSFMFLKEYWFRELYLGLKVTASFDRSESYTRVIRVIDGQKCITQKLSRRIYRSSGTCSSSLCLSPHG